MALDDYLKQVDKVIKRDDIRGVYGDGIDSDFAYNLGLVLAESFIGCTAVEPVNVVVGHDMRVSGAELAQALCTGLDDGGCRAIMMGRVGTELVGFLPTKYPDVIDGGIIITASHNPKDNNGFKFFGRAGAPLPLAVKAEPPCPDDEFERIALAVKKRRIPTRLTWDDVAPDYILTALERGGLDFSELGRGPAGPLRVAVEAGNGMGGMIMGEFAKLTPQFEWTFSNAVPDGSFPHIVPNPLMADYQAMASDLVLRTGSHIGLCFDGDADRVAVFDETGRLVSPPQFATLIGQRLRAKLGGETRTAFNLASSWVVADTLGDRSDVLGGSGAVMTPVGYTKIKAAMYGDPTIAFGAEHSGHYMFREFGCADSGMLAGLVMLELAAELHAEGRTISSLLEGSRARYRESGEINFQLPADKPGDDEIARMTREFAGEIKRMYVVVNDGCVEVGEYPRPGLELSVSDVRAEADGWWFVMRKSGTEASAGDLLRLYLEADGDQALRESKRDAMVEAIGPGLRI